MKSLLLAISMTTTIACGAANAADTPQRVLAPITVQDRRHAECTPPSSDATCASLHAQIRRHFTQREYGMLFGARTTYPEAATSYARVNERYLAFVRDFGASEEPSVAVAAR